MMMKNFLPTICIAATLLFVLPQCSHESGALTNEDIHAALASPQIALTPHIPGWLLEPEHIHILSHQDRESLIKIANTGTPRFIPVEYYEDEEAGNRGDDSKNLFYLYASNSQCLGCRVVADHHVLIDDLDLSVEATADLYQLLIPYYEKMKAAGAPKLKDAETLTEKEKSFSMPASYADKDYALRTLDYSPIKTAPKHLPKEEAPAAPSKPNNF